jgi:hypothetical protein
VTDLPHISFSHVSGPERGFLCHDTEAESAERIYMSILYDLCRIVMRSERFLILLSTFTLLPARRVLQTWRRSTSIDI